MHNLQLKVRAQCTYRKKRNKYINVKEHTRISQLPRHGQSYSTKKEAKETHTKNKNLRTIITCPYTHIQVHTACTHARLCTMDIHMHNAHIYIQQHTHSNTYMHAHTHTHMHHTHTNTCAHIFPSFCVFLVHIKIVDCSLTDHC